MKIIFLDFDGVITTHSTKWNIGLEYVKRIKKICDETGAKLVISSSWQRYGKKEESREERVKNWLDGILMKEYNGSIKKFFTEYTYDMSGRFYGEFGNVRGSDIKSWLTRNPDVDRYVIIDDEADMLDEQIFNFVQTDMSFGIQDREVKLCIDILNGIKPQNILTLNDNIKFKYWISLGYGKVDNYKEIVEKYYPWKNENK